MHGEHCRANVVINAWMRRVGGGSEPCVRSITGRAPRDRNHRGVVIRDESRGAHALTGVSVRAERLLDANVGRQ